MSAALSAVHHVTNSCLFTVVLESTGEKLCVHSDHQKGGEVRQGTFGYPTGFRSLGEVSQYMAGMACKARWPRYNAIMVVIWSHIGPFTGVAEVIPTWPLRWE